MKDKNIVVYTHILVKSLQCVMCHSINVAEEMHLVCLNVCNARGAHNAEEIGIRFGCSYNRDTNIKRNNVCFCCLVFSISLSSKRLKLFQFVHVYVYICICVCVCYGIENRLCRRSSFCF